MTEQGVCTPSSENPSASLKIVGSFNCEKIGDWLGTINVCKNELRLVGSYSGEQYALATDMQALECGVEELNCLMFINESPLLNEVAPSSFCYNSFLYLSSPCSYAYCAETEQGVAQAIIRSVIDFKRDPWPKVSDNAKDLVKKMLDPDPSRRLTAQQVLGNVRTSN